MGDVLNNGTSGQAAPTLITVDHCDGASGPTLLVVLETLAGVELLKAAFDRLAAARVGTVLPLHHEAGVSLRSSVSEVNLRVTNKIPAHHLHQDGNRAFEWRNTNYEWETARMMLEPFLDGRPGHQYLTNDYPPDPNVTVSFGEGLHPPPND